MKGICAVCSCPSDCLKVAVYLLWYSVLVLLYAFVDCVCSFDSVFHEKGFFPFQVKLSCSELVQKEDQCLYQPIPSRLPIPTPSWGNKRVKSQCKLHDRLVASQVVNKHISLIHSFNSRFFLKLYTHSDEMVMANQRLLWMDSKCEVCSLPHTLHLLPIFSYSPEFDGS